MKLRGKSSLRLMFLLSLSLFSFRSALAEEITVYGVPFEIDSMEHFGEATLKLTLDGRAVLISSGQLQSQVLKHAASKGELKGRAVEENLRIAEGALEAEDLRSVAIVFPSLVLHKDLSSADLESIIKRISKTDAGKDILDRFWAEYSSRLPVKTQAHVMLLFLEDGKSSVVNLVPESELEKELWLLVEDRLKGILEQGGQCEGFAQSITAAFGANGERARFTSEACSLSSAARAAEQNNDVDSILAIIKSAKNDLSRNLVEPVLVRILHAKASYLMSEGKHLEALTLLADVPSSRISPTTHELTLNAISNISDIFKEISLESSTGKFLLYVSDKNDTIKKSFSRAIESSVLFSAARADWSNVDAGLSFLGQSSRTNQSNDDLWFSVAMYAVKSGDLEKAQGYFNAQVGEVGLLRKVQFYLAGGYGGRWIIVLVISILIALIVVSRKALKLRRNRAFQNIHENISVGGIVEESKLTPEETRELNKSLVRLGLEPKASEQEIKNAFREMAKKIHPDSKHNESTVEKSATDDFIELTKAYDIALKLTQKQSEV
jgi:hypothetical protein